MTVQTKAPNDDLLPLIALLSLSAIAAMAWWPIEFTASQHGQHIPLSPVALVIGLAKHTVTWPGSGIYVLYAAQLLVLAVVGTLLLRRISKRSKGKTRADTTNRHLAGTAEMVGLTPAQVKASAQRLRTGADLTDPDQHGVLVMQTLLSKTPLRMSWEDIMVVIAGPRVGKTTSVVVTAVVGYQGPLKASSNKADLHDATRGVRDDLGRVWMCDPQYVVNVAPPAGHVQPTPFWWDPLGDVTDIGVARELVQILVDTSTDPDAKPDAYFHPTAKTTLTNLVLAAALDLRPLSDVADWLSDVENPQAAAILDRLGHPAAATQIRSVMTKPDRQRDGVLGTAQSWLSVVANPRFNAWLTPPLDGRPQFYPEDFVRSDADTLYLLSQEGPASASFITTALNAAVDRAANHYARTQPGRRLANPLLSVLDEAANTIRDTTLPDKVSHFGSRGLPTVIVLQSWSQGVEVWGERGMRKLWSAANLKVYLGGVGETEFLKSMSDLLGDRDERYWTRSSSRNHTGNSTSTAEQIRRVPIMSPADLASLPRGRALLLSSGNRAAIGRPVPWMTGPHAAAIAASLAKWESPDDRDLRQWETDQAIVAVLETELHDQFLTDPRLAATITDEGVVL